MLKRVDKLVLEEDYQNRDDIKDIIRCILGLLLLPAADIPTSLQEIRATICNDMQMARQLQQLVMYVQRQWIDTGNDTTSTDSSDTSCRCGVHLIQPRADVALVPWNIRVSVPVAQTSSHPWTVIA